MQNPFTKLATSRWGVVKNLLTGPTAQTVAGGATGLGIGEGLHGAGLIETDWGRATTDLGLIASMAALGNPAYRRRITSRPVSSAELKGRHPKARLSDLPESVFREHTIPRFMLASSIPGGVASAGIAGDRGKKMVDKLNKFVDQVDVPKTGESIKQNA